MYFSKFILKMTISTIPVYQILLSIQDLLTECSSSEVPIELQNIVTIGIQSAGKSSVIENISEIELPRNNGIGTKAPLQIRLRKASDKEYCRIKYGNDTDNNWEEININQTNEYIRKYQDNLFKDRNDDDDNDVNTQLTNSLIVLEIYKKDSCDLTIIDLPGITHVDHETEEMVKKMVIEYIKNPKTIVLFAHNATADFVSDECINLIKSVSEGELKNKDNILNRIIPVLTKIDLATTEELIRNIEDCKRYKFGYPPILVRNSNRGNADFNNESNSCIGGSSDIENDGKDDTNSLKNYNEERKLEQETINKHLNNSKLKNLCSDHQGINGLIKKLVEIQSLYLFNSKDEFKNIIRKTLKNYKNKLDNLPKILNNKKEFFDIITELDNNFNELLLNKFITPNNLLPESNFNEEKFMYCLESRIRLKFEEFKEMLNKKFLNYLTLDYYKEMKYIRRDSQKLKLENFCGEEIIYSILHNCLDEYFEEFKELIEDIDSIISGVVDDVFNSSFEKYENVLDKFVEISQEKLIEMKSKNLDLCKQFLESMKKNETTSHCIFNKHYINVAKLILNELKKEVKLKLESDEQKPQNKNSTNSQQYNIKKNDNYEYDKDYREQLFFDSTGLTLDYIKEFGSELLEDSKDNENQNIEFIDWDSIKIISSVYSYLKSFMDRILDGIYKEIDIDLLSPFKNRIFFQKLQKHFLLMSDNELEPIMNVSDDTKKKIKKFNTIIEKLKQANTYLNSINKNTIFKSSKKILQY